MKIAELAKTRYKTEAERAAFNFGYLVASLEHRKNILKALGYSEEAIIEVYSQLFDQARKQQKTKASKDQTDRILIAGESN